LQGVVDRINALSEKARSEGGKVIWIRHCENALMDLNAARPDRRFFSICCAAMRILLSKKLLNDPCWDFSKRHAGSISAPPRPCDRLGDGLLR
jgi:hypothetical protein